MGKVYKGYELYKMISDREIKKDSKFKDNNSRIWIWDGFNFVTEECDYNDFVFSLIDFELLEDEEIDIQEIEELSTYSDEGIEFYDKNEIHGNRLKINEIIRAVKQLDNKIKEKKM